MNLTKYLSERVSQVDVNSDKIVNEGCRLLANYPTWEEKLEEIINDAWDSLVKYCIRNRSSTHSASVKLTFASSTIGQRVAKRINVEPLPKTVLALGDLLLETFLQEDIIEIAREYDGWKAPYVVRIHKMPNTVKPQLIGTLFFKPAPIKGLFSPYTGEPYIKGWTSTKEFKKYIDTPHIQALDRLRQVGWEINPVVLSALKVNAPKNYLQLCDKDGVIFNYSLVKTIKKIPKHLYHMDETPFLGKSDPKLQRAISKYFEYQQIVKKAEMIVSGNKGKFWQELTCDYRGRMYYAESFLEYQGSDMSRSLFLFQESKEVNEEGYYQMLIHAANCYNQSFSLKELKKLSWTNYDYVSYLKSEGLDSISLDKMTLADRINWGLHNKDQLCEWGRTRKVIPEAEKPYALLAVCNELYQMYVVNLAGKTYSSKLAIPIDGSNNGKLTCHCKTL